MSNATTDTDVRPTIVLVRGCGPLGHALAEGLGRRGHRTVSLDGRTAAGRTETRCVDLRDAHALRWEFARIGRSSGSVAAVVILPRHRGPISEAWEQAAAEDLLETAGVVRAGVPVLQRGGRLVMIPAGSAGREPGNDRSTPAEVIVELGAAAIATEAGLAVTRCILPTTTAGIDAERATRQLLAAIAGPGRRASTVDVGLPRREEPRSTARGGPRQPRPADRVAIASTS